MKLSLANDRKPCKNQHKSPMPSGQASAWHSSNDNTFECAPITQWATRPRARLQQARNAQRAAPAALWMAWAARGCSVSHAIARPWLLSGGCCTLPASPQSRLPRHRPPRCVPSVWQPPRVSLARFDACALHRSSAAATRSSSHEHAATSSPTLGRQPRLVTMSCRSRRYRVGRSGMNAAAMRRVASMPTR